jgi:hypothetical protein
LNCQLVLDANVGDFNVDIYASEIGTDRKIVIENQLEATDHDHLGKLITYKSGKGADVVIWIVKHARDEHKAAIEWLNNNTDENIGFFLCEIKLFQIGNSDIAPSFVVVEKPNDWVKEIKMITATNPTQQQRLEYLQAFNDYAFKNKEFAKTFNKRKPTIKTFGEKRVLTLTRNKNICGGIAWTQELLDFLKIL